MVAAAAFAGPAFAETLKIGLATAQTGGLAGYDGPVIEGLHIAVDEINAAGGNNMIELIELIELIEKDVRSDAARLKRCVGSTLTLRKARASPSLAPTEQENLRP